jgi:hypothetical protein
MQTEIFYLDNILEYSLNLIYFIIKIVIASGSIYLILQRFHLRLQMRFLKNISDEILKINDFCIEFEAKFHQYKVDTDTKNLTDLLTIRNKIHNHLDYLTSAVNSFPYGNPLNFFWFSLTNEYFSKKNQTKADALLTNYQGKISDDTVLQKNFNLKKQVKTKLNLMNVHNNISEIDQFRIDEIILAGLDLIEMLEDHSKKLF